MADKYSQNVRFNICFNMVEFVFNYEENRKKKPENCVRKSNLDQTSREKGTVFGVTLFNLRLT